MKKFLTFLILCLISHHCLAKHPRDQWLTTEQIVQDVQLVREAYERIHPGYDRYIEQQQLTKQWNAIITQANQDQGMQLAEFYLLLSETTALMRCDHTKVELPKTLAKARETIPVYLPFKWQFIENQMLVEQASEQSGLQRGDQIIAIDGMPVEARFAALLKYIPVDGFTDHTKMNLMAASTEHRGGALDHFGAMLWPTEEQVSLTFINNQGQRAETTVKRVNYAEWKQLSGAKRRNFIDAVEYQQVSDQTGYLKIDTFVNYRNPIKPDKLYDPLFKQLKANNTQRLILDLRNNGGGSDEPPHRLLAHLMDKKFRPAKDIRIKTLNLDGLREHMFTWEKEALYPKASRFNQNDDGSYSFKPHVLNATAWIKPDKTAFNGELIVLTSHNNSSGSTNLLTVLKNRPNTTFVGEPTGGSVEGPTAGILFFMQLPASGITARIPMFRQYNDVSDFDLGQGIQPDVKVSVNKQDFIKGVDTILQTAIDWQP